jgi:hypothetical protein
MVQRNRNTVGLTESATFTVRTRLSEKGWTQLQWSSFGNASLSTVRRILGGKAIEPSILTSLLKALSLELEEACFIRGSKPTAAKVLEEELTTESSNHPNGIMMTGRYNQNKKAEIDRAVRHLRGLMVDTEFCFEESEGAIMVSGSFPEENAPQIRMVINRLERLLTASQVTW